MSIQCTTQNQTAYCLMGPTAIGKTALALEWARAHPIDIINVDSALIYKGLDKGTGKPTPQEQAVCPHALIDILDPTETYSVAQFCADAMAAIEHTLVQNRIPLLVGGTMLYFRALQFGMHDLPTADPVVRTQLQQQLETDGLACLYNSLMAVDPETAQKYHPNDTQRILRALEVYQQTGTPLSVFQKGAMQKNTAFNFKSVGLIPIKRAWLHDRIEKRFLQMLDAGLVEELENLRAHYPDLSALHPAMRSVGYRQVWGYLNGEYTYTDMITRALAATRQLAKRQLTWMRKWPGLKEVEYPTDKPVGWPTGFG